MENTESGGDVYGTTRSTTDRFRLNLRRREEECGKNGQSREIKKYRIDVVARGARQIQPYPVHKGIYPVIRM